MAQNRNWALFKLKGLHLPTGSYITAEEENTMREILAIRDKLVKGWDNNSLKLGINLKPYKCESCGKRSYKTYLIDEINYCKYHYTLFNTYSYV